MIVVSNREDANTYKMARDCMAALNDLSLPETNCTIPDGLYVTDSGPFWLEMRNGIANWLDSEDTLYDIGDGWFSSLSSSSPVELRWTGVEAGRRNWLCASSIEASGTEPGVQGTRRPLAGIALWREF